MSADPRVERRLPEILTGLGTGPTPDYTDSILARTVATRQRPSWMFTSRLFTMTAITSPAAPVRRVPWRTIGIAALLFLALAVGAVLTAGSQPRRLPPPFGLAANGDLVYLSNGELWAARADGSDPHPLTSERRPKGVPLFSRDGTKLAYLAYPSGMTSSEATRAAPDLVVARADGSHPVTIAQGLTAARHVSWSLEGSSLLYSFQTADVYTSQHDRVFRAAADGTGSPVMVGDPELSAFYPILSPDGSRIAFISDSAPDLCTPATCVDPNTFALYVMDADGSNVRVLVNGAIQPAEPADRWTRIVDWSLDGKHIVFTGMTLHDPESRRVYVVDAAGGDPVEIDTRESRALGATYSPDGRRIAFILESGRTWDAYVIDPDQRNAHLIRSGVEAFAPQWSPDGRALVVIDPVTSPDVTIRVVPVDGDPPATVLHATTSQANAMDLGVDMVSWQRVGS